MTLGITAVLAITGLGALVIGPERAYACTVDASYNPVAESSLVVRGTVVSLSDEVPADLGGAPDEWRLAIIEVDEVFKGNPAVTTAEVYIRVRGATPQLCPTLDAGDLAGRDAVFGVQGVPLRHTASEGTIWFTDTPPASRGEVYLARIAGHPTDLPVLSAHEVFLKADGVDAALAHAPAKGTVADALGTLTIYADGELCGTLDLSALELRDPSGAAEFVLGGISQPEACRTAGATVCIASAKFGGEAGYVLAQRFTFVPGETIRVTNYAPSPARDDCSALVLLPPDVGTGMGGDGAFPEQMTAIAGGLAFVGAGAFVIARRARR